MKQKIKGLIAYLKTVDNLYYKVVLGIIAFALLWIAVNLQDLYELIEDLYELIDYKF
uniref:hypothetical protein n=1 Tax=Prevotellamassilia timonensis TaxID=1852370 RepID=UPI004025E211